MSTIDKERYLAWWNDLSNESLDDCVGKIRTLTARWSQGSRYTQQVCSSGYGATVVAFVPESSRLHANVRSFVHFLDADTLCGRAGRLKLNPLPRIHLTVRGLVAEQAKDLTAGQIAQLQETVQHAVDSFSTARPAAVPVVAFENDISISPSARINLMGLPRSGALLEALSDAIDNQIRALGVDRAAGLGLNVPGRKGDHLSLASIVDERITQREFDDLRQKLADYRASMAATGFGTLEIPSVTFVHHYDDLLDQCHPGHERSYPLPAVKDQRRGAGGE